MNISISFKILRYWAERDFIGWDPYDMLNSKLINFWLSSKGKMQGSSFQIDKAPLLNIPIRIPNDYSPFLINIEKIIKLNQNDEDFYIYEKALDKIIYELYELDCEDIKLIEECIPDH